MRSRSSLLLLLAVTACAPARPAHFKDAPVVEEVHDDGDIAMPRRFDPVKETALSEAYIERPMIDALNPLRAPEAGDVNALDDVPQSTWFSTSWQQLEAMADVTEQPAPPYHLTGTDAVTREHAISVVDARGRRFEVWRDPPDRPEMATGAAAVAARLLRRLGYFTPGVWAMDARRTEFVAHSLNDLKALGAMIDSGPFAGPGAFRVAFTRWPIGTDLGPTATSGVRLDDPNDRVAHEDRRTLRAMKLIFGWLGMTQTDAAVLRDVYVGAPGRGHVVHYIAGLGGALGADAVVRVQPPRDDDSDLASLNVWITLGSLGLYQQRVSATSKRWPALGEYRGQFFPPAFHTSPPIAPMDRMLPADGYWAARRIATIETPALVDAVEAGRYHDTDAQNALIDLLRVRQGIAIRWGVTHVTSCEIERLEQAPEGKSAVLLMRDAAPALGIVTSGATKYRMAIVDTEGRAVAPTSDIELTDGVLFPVQLPPSLPSYVVVRVRVIRSTLTAPRSMEVHLSHTHEWKVVGVVH